ncbi:MAG: HAD-IA family hydrolase [Oscillospiraceae bacterium]|nr:HAD-IA family hydrolase [Oscillospiraceae bacterium]
MKYRLICFDYDYTLGNTEGGIAESIEYALREMNLSVPSRERIYSTIGLTLSKTYLSLTGDDSTENAARFSSLFVEKADQVMARSAVWLPTAEETLRKLKNAGFIIGICTTKFNRRIKSILELNGCSELVDVIVGGDDVPNSKPAPDGLLYTLERTGVSLGEMLYVGDSYVDAQAAMAAGVDFAAVTSGTTVLEDFTHYPNVGVFANVGEMADSLILKAVG